LLQTAGGHHRHTRCAISRKDRIAQTHSHRYAADHSLNQQHDCADAVTELLPDRIRVFLLHDHHGLRVRPDANDYRYRNLARSAIFLNVAPAYPQIASDALTCVNRQITSDRHHAPNGHRQRCRGRTSVSSQRALPRTISEPQWINTAYLTPRPFAPGERRNDGGAADQRPATPADHRPLYFRSVADVDVDFAQRLSYAR
jgi:hypothetical protein